MTMDSYDQQWDYVPEDLHGTGGSAQHMRSAASDPQDLQPAVRKAAKWNSPKHKIFITTCETVTAEGHRRGKCFSMKGW
ncbi:Hypothetical predicted protein [Olea europaea subsp. europaea]|uniref:Uncharacterized protein n=1 Tax=Olea europaea subsp. europaea TaxID=158383 RepID=A0A8S0SJ47_OLEEU|nr:Hypothetical predicted protein [Olea europaea subsp. europaea]